MRGWILNVFKGWQLLCINTTHNIKSKSVHDFLTPPQQQKYDYFFSLDFFYIVVVREGKERKRCWIKRICWVLVNYFVIIIYLPDLKVWLTLLMYKVWLILQKDGFLVPSSNYIIKGLILNFFRGLQLLCKSTTPTPTHNMESRCAQLSNNFSTTKKCMFLHFIYIFHCFCKRRKRKQTRLFFVEY
jgi:hypothetical protein